MDRFILTSRIQRVRRTCSCDVWFQSKKLVLRCHHLASSIFIFSWQWETFPTYLTSSGLKYLLDKRRAVRNRRNNPKTHRRVLAGLLIIKTGSTTSLYKMWEVHVWTVATFSCCSQQVSCWKQLHLGVLWITGRGTNKDWKWCHLCAVYSSSLSNDTWVLTSDCLQWFNNFIRLIKSSFGHSVHCHTLLSCCRSGGFH